ncbi:hypothetical protein GN956_G21614 [Arapaima gigas]
MFYYPTVLQRHTGRFSVIWLAATKGIKIARRDFLSVDIHRTCNDIMDYVLVRAPPIQPGLPRPRFSLYLSAQLQYGVIIVYHRQCAILLEEIQHAIDKLLRSEKRARIDLEEEDRVVLTLPDVLSTLEETERAQDPFFGMVGPGYELPSPSTLVQQWRLEKEPSPEPPAPVSPTAEDGITASPESITLREEPAVIPEAQFEGVDFPQVTAEQMDIIEMLMEQEDEFPKEEEEQEMVREMEVEEVAEEPGIMVSVEQLGVTPAVEEEAVFLLDEEMGLPVELPGAVPVEKTPSGVSLPPPSPDRERELEDERLRERAREREPPREEVKVTTRRRRRQLLFIDEQTQISQEALREQINTPQTETRPLDLIEPPSHMRIPPAVLLNNPCLPLHPDVLSLWQQAAVVRPRREPEPEAEPEMERDEISSREVSVDTLKWLLLFPVPSELFLEASDRDVSHLAPPESRGSPVAELVPLEGILEERAAPPPRELLEKAVDVEMLLEQVEEPLEQEGETTFHSLLPPGADRYVVARSFCALLELLSARKLRARQEEPYGPIIISPGELYP